MRVILWLVALFTVLWSGYWFLAARTLRAETEAALTQMKAEGRADYSAFDLGGFPARFKLTVTDPALADPGGRWRWRAPSLTVHALAYDPGKIIALLPSGQTIEAAGQTIALTTTDMRTSAGFGLSTALPLLHAEAISDATEAKSDRGWTLAAREIRLAIREEDATSFRYRLGAKATALALSGPPAESLARANLPASPGQLRIDADATFDRALDRTAIDTPPMLRALAVSALELDWGDLSLRGDGRIDISAAGTPEGAINLRLGNWQGLPPLLVATGIVPPEMEQQLGDTMRQLAALSGDPKELALPLTFNAGWMALGPLPLGPAPRF
ncbi:MAG: DUF2125 domain-containing protein [Proteobacteria bacterium]|nr:DUF2125 domain-containing protein [Pseudomonadota bacterium]